MSGFGKRIRRIEAQIGNLTWDGELFNYPEFREIHAHPASYLSAAWDALRSTEFTDQQKIIIAFSMQGLDLPRFMRFANDMLRLLESGMISYDVFKLAVFPPLEWNSKLAENYDQPDVARFLQRVLKSEQVEDRRKEIIRERTLTGKARLYALNMQFWKEMGMKSRLKAEAAQALSDFVEKIKKIEAQIGDLRTPNKLFEVPDFRELHEHPTDHTLEVSKVLEGPEFTDRQKMIAALSLQGLEMPWFLLIAEHMLLLLESGLVSYDVFELAVFPPYDWNTKLIENYEEWDVARFLRSVLESEQVEDRRKEIIRKEILTGKAKSYVLNRRDAGPLG